MAVIIAPELRRGNEAVRAGIGELHEQAKARDARDAPWKFSAHPELLTGVMFAIFSIALAAAEAAVGLAIVIQLHRRLRSVDVNAANQLKG